MRERIKVKGLDSLRFIAFLWVFIGHSTPFWKYGYYGIYIFFVLSSFLLTYLSLAEIKHSGKFSKSNFFIRRSLRIYPLYYLVVTTSFVLLPILAKFLNSSISLPEKKYLYFLFLSNFDNSDHIFALKFLWSISVEEQFYVLFIFISFFFKRHFYLPIIFFYVTYFMTIPLGKLYNWNTYTLTTTYFPLFSTGMIAAKIFFDKKIPGLMILLLIIVVSFFIILSLNHLPFSQKFLELPISFLIATVILFVVKFFEIYPTNNILFRATEYLGKYTYGLYVYSGFILTFITFSFPGMNLIFKFFFECIILFAVAWCSYHFFEEYFIKLKERFKIGPLKKNESSFIEPK